MQHSFYGHAFGPGKMLTRPVGPQCARMSATSSMGSAPRAGQSFAERKVCDVAVIGCSPAGLAAAQELVRQGRRVVAVDMAWMPTRQTEASCGLTLQHPEPLMCHLAKEGLGYLRSLESRLLCSLHEPCGSLTVELPNLDDSLAHLEDYETGSRLDRMLSACREADVAADMLMPDQVRARWRVLKPPMESRSLQVREGGVLLIDKMTAALRETAERSGVEVRRDRLLGWRDAGGYFKLRIGYADTYSPTSGAGQSTVLLEAEQLLLAPDLAVAPELLETFGLRGGLQVGSAISGRWPAINDMEKSPVLYVGRKFSEDQGGLLFPRMAGNGPRAKVSTYPSSSNTAQRTDGAPRDQNGLDEEMDELYDEPQAEQPSDRERMKGLLAEVSRLTNSAVNIEEQPTAFGRSFHSLTTDGSPIFGSHVSWEEGQVVAAVPSSQPAGGAGGVPLGLALGRAAAGLLCGVTSPLGRQATLSLRADREPLGMHAQAGGPLGIDTWDGLHLLQLPAGPLGKDKEGKGPMGPGGKAKPSQQRQYFF